MASMNDIYKCDLCGQIIEVLHGGIGELVCCAKPMVMLKAKTEEEGNEKHLPVIEQTENGVKVKVGSVEHPMEEEHFIQWIEILANGKVYRQNLKPGMKPEAEFCVTAEKIVAREYCNVHGLWIKE